MSNLSDLFPAGAGKQVSFTASGAISSGDPVILNSDGTVTSVGTSYSSVIAGASGTWGVNTQHPRAAYDTVNDKLVIVYKDESNNGYATAVVATIGASSITFGTPAVYNSVNSNRPDVAYDANAQKVVIVWNENTNKGEAVVGTVSGTSISFGTVVEFRSAGTNGQRITYDSTNQKVVVAYQNTTNNNGEGIVGTVSGTSISFGSATVFDSSVASTSIGITYDSNAQKVVIGYAENSGADAAAAVVGTVSGTSISFGTPNIYFSSLTCTPRSITYDANAQKVVTTMSTSSGAGLGQAAVGTVSGTSISFGSLVTFNAENTSDSEATYWTAGQNIVISFRANDGTAKGIVGTVSGTSISFGSASLVSDATTVAYTASAYDPDTAQVIQLFRGNNPTQTGNAVALAQGTNLTADNFIGLADGAISDTASGNVTIKGGVSTKVSGLTPNSTYYVQDDGSLSTTSSDVLAGRALSATSIDLDYST
jgi:hypothetical protein